MDDLGNLPEELGKNVDLGNFCEASLRVGVFYIGSAENTKNELQKNQTASPNSFMKLFQYTKNTARWISFLTPWLSSCLPLVYDLDFMPDLSTRGQTFIHSVSHLNSIAGLRENISLPSWFE